MQGNDMDVEIELFLRGEQDSLRFGGYGGTVRVKAEKDGVRINVSMPKKQTTLTPNNRRTRETAVAVALGVIEQTRAPNVPELPAARPSPAGLLTPREIWMSYLVSRFGPLPANVFDWGRKEVEQFVANLPKNARADAPTPDSMSAILVAARRLDRDGVVPLDGDFGFIEPGNLNLWTKQALAESNSLHTPDTYLRRFRTAVRRFKAEWPGRWGDRPDPTEHMAKIDTSHVRPDEIGEEVAEVLLYTLRDMGEWRAYASAGVAHATGRRIGAISAARYGLHIDAPPLTANDLRIAEDGSAEVVWRAAAQKGRGFGHGDVVLPAPALLEEVIRWVAEAHPNPLGPDHPLIWDETDPTRAERYDRLNHVLGKAWKKAFGVKKPKGLGWHAFCRTTITTLVDATSLVAAAEFTGRSTDTIARIYKRVRQPRLRDTARKLDQVRSSGALNRGRPEPTDPLADERGLPGPEPL
jgi:hypothetical protein